MRLQDYRGAIDDYNKAIEINPKLAAVYRNRWLTKIFIGEKESGLMDLSKAGELGDAKAYELISKYSK